MSISPRKLSGNAVPIVYIGGWGMHAQNFVEKTDGSQTVKKIVIVSSLES